MGSFPIGKNSRGSKNVVENNSVSSSLVLDEERGKLVRASLGRVSRKGGGSGDKVLNVKAAMALKNHSEAERRRRERINGHLSALRSLVPCSDKLDKAALLAEVINHLKKLKSSALQSSKDLSIPSDVNEVMVDIDESKVNQGLVVIKASLSCEDRPDLLENLRQTFQSLKLKIIKADITTLGGRIKNDFVMTCEENTCNDKQMHIFTSNVKQALMSVLDRAALLEFDTNKRRRISPFESSCSSS